MLQRLLWHDQTKSCVRAVQTELGPHGRNLRYLKIEDVSASRVERSILDQAPPVRVSGILDIEGVFTLDEHAVQCVMRKSEIDLRQRPEGTLPRHCPDLLKRLDDDVRWHESLGFRLGDGRSSRARVEFGCRFADDQSLKVHFFEPLRAAR
ncbi:MAG: hypothetical protein KIT81_13895 [Alphaproteobacteria bacterium]|nr:hypothetical protein [Alphaproteobacteria bacterium]